MADIYRITWQIDSDMPKWQVKVNVTSQSDRCVELSIKWQTRNWQWHNNPKWQMSRIITWQTNSDMPTWQIKLTVTSQSYRCEELSDKWQTDSDVTNQSDQSGRCLKVREKLTVTGDMPKWQVKLKVTSQSDSDICVELSI